MQNSENNEAPLTPNPNQPAPAAGPTPAPAGMPQPTPMGVPPTPAPAGMPQPTPMMAQSANSAKSNSSLGTISVLASLIPPAGLILGILSIIKGSKNNNKKLSLFGGVAILLSILIGLLYAFVVAPRIPAFAGSNYSKTKNITVSGGSINITVPIPKAFEEVSLKNSSTLNSYGINSKTYAIYGDTKEKKDTIAAFNFQATGLSDDEKDIFKVAKITRDRVIDKILETEDQAIIDDIESAGAGDDKLTNVKIVSKEKSGDNGYVVKYTAQGKSLKGKPVEVVGTVSGYFSEDYSSVTLSLLVEKNTYNKNKKVFDNIANSAKNQIK